MASTKEIIENSFKTAGLLEFCNEAVIAKFETLLKELVTTNERVNLTAITEPSEVALRHFADSLTAAKHIPKGASVIDVGCGGGFPTLPLAIARPDLKISALDSTAKKLVFVEEMAKKLSLNVTVFAKRAEEATELREHFDVAVSRAVARLSALSELCLPLVKVGGLFVALKGADGKEELSEAKNALSTLGSSLLSCEEFTLGEAGARAVIVCKKTRATPKEYPRAWGKIKKKPL